VACGKDSRLPLIEAARVDASNCEQMERENSDPAAARKSLD